MNTTRAANFYLQTKGHWFKVVTAGSIGHDSLANEISDQIQEEYILGHIYLADGALTGQCAVTVVDADRTCVAVLDACEKYPKSHLLQVLERPEMSSVMFYYTTAFFIESNFEALKALMYHANSYNKIFGFNIAAGYIFEEKLEKMKEILSYCDIVICNKDDAHACA